MTDQAPTPTAEAPRKATAKPGKPLPTNRIGLPKQLDLLRAFGALYLANNRPVAQADVAALVEMHIDTTRLANPFFVDAGLLTRIDNAYTPNADVISFNRAREWNDDTAARKLAPTIRETWFAKALLTKLAFRSAIDEQEAIQILADAANASPDFKTQLQLLLGYLQESGLIERDGNVLRPKKSDDSSGDTERQTDKPLAPRLDPPRVDQGQSAMRTVRLPKANGSVTLSGDVNLFALAGDERKLVFELIDLMEAFEKQNATSDTVPPFIAGRNRAITLEDDK